MPLKIRKAMVLGAGAMGSSLAALLAGAGIRTYLLDIVPQGASGPERDSLARTGLGNALKAKPPAFYVPEDADLIVPGNVEDHLGLASEVDWVLEAVVEDLEIKRGLFRRLDGLRREDALVSSNTSGISINAMAEGLSEGFKSHFMGTHFFNPPRYMRLLEIIPGTDTREELVEGFAEFGERVLGKGVVVAKDTPNFIANRIGIYAFLECLRACLKFGISVEEADAITGRPMGRPGTATFGTADLVGIDVLADVAMNVRRALPEGEEKSAFSIPEVIEQMIQKGLLGRKAGRGFYSRDPAGKPMALNLASLEYRPRADASSPVLQRVSGLNDPAERLRALIAGQDLHSRFAWEVTKRSLIYSAHKLGEIADTPVDVDNALKWGFGWKLGPFETWDALGVEACARRMEGEGESLPGPVRELLSSGRKAFYSVEGGVRRFFDFALGEERQILPRPGLLDLPGIRASGGQLFSNSGGSLLDIGDGVALLEFHSPRDAIGPDAVEMMGRAAEEVERGFDALVIGSRGRHFGVGANLMLLLLAAEEGEWDEIDFMVRSFQSACRRLTYMEKPVVAAPFGMALGGGCEICLASDKIRAAAETYMGLVETGVGLVPAGGGTLAMLRRALDVVPPRDPESRIPLAADPAPLIARAFEIIATAKVAGSAREACKLGFMRPTDAITPNPDRLISDAKQSALALAREGYSPPRERPVLALGEEGRALLDMLIYNMKTGGFISEYDAHVAGKLAYVITGGSARAGSLVTGQYILELEREAFLSLCGQPKTLERIRHMLSTGKPLRN